MYFRSKVALLNNLPHSYLSDFPVTSEDYYIYKIKIIPCLVVIFVAIFEYELDGNISGQLGEMRI